MPTVPSRRRELAAISYASHTSHPFSCSSYLAPGSCFYPGLSPFTSSHESLPLQGLGRPPQLRLLHFLPQPQITIVPFRADPTGFYFRADRASGLDSVRTVPEPTRWNESAK